MPPIFMTPKVGYHWRIAEAINTLPRKILDYNTPAELFRKQIELLEKESLAESTKATAGENDTGSAIVKK